MTGKRISNRDRNGGVYVFLFAMFYGGAICGQEGQALATIESEEGHLVRLRRAATEAGTMQADVFVRVWKFIMTDTNDAVERAEAVNLLAEIDLHRAASHALDNLTFSPPVTSFLSSTQWMDKPCQHLLLVHFWSCLKQIVTHLETHAFSDEEIDLFQVIVMEHPDLDHPSYTDAESWLHQQRLDALVSRSPLYPSRSTYRTNIDRLVRNRDFAATAHQTMPPPVRIEDISASASVPIVEAPGSERNEPPAPASDNATLVTPSPAEIDIVRGRPPSARGPSAGAADSGWPPLLAAFGAGVALASVIWWRLSGRHRQSGRGDQAA